MRFGRKEFRVGGLKLEGKNIMILSSGDLVIWAI